jgi:hypothetical protein
MTKRHIVPFLQQVALACWNPLRQFALVPTAEGRLALPTKTVYAQNQTYRSCMDEYCNELQITVDVLGIVRLDVGNDGCHNYYRCIYYAQTK